MSQLKSETQELLQYLTPQERAELEMLAAPPDNANCCLVIHKGDGDAGREETEAINRYVTENGYAPPVIYNIQFIAPN